MLSTQQKEALSTPTLPLSTFHLYVLCLCFTFEKGDDIYVLFRVKAVGFRKKKITRSYVLVTILILVFCRERGHDFIPFGEAPVI